MHAGQVRDFRDLIVWQRATELTQSIYVLCRTLPASEQFRFTDQLKRASASVGANIAEGHSKPYRKEFVRFLNIAYGSLKETEHHLLTAAAVGLVHRADIAEPLALCSEVGRMLTTMRRRLQGGPGTARPP